MLDLLDNWVMGLLSSNKNYEPKIGDHIYVPRSLGRDLEKCTNFKVSIAEPHFAVTSLIGYTHHAIYIGNNKVIHYDGEPGNENNAEIQIASLEKFAAGDPINLYSDESEFTPGEMQQL